MATTKRAQAEQAGKTAEYEVLSRLMFDGETYEPGEKVTLDAETAKGLLDVKCIAQPERAAAK